MKNNVCQDIKGREVPRPQKRTAKAGLTASRGPTCTYWQESEAQWAPSRGQVPPPPEKQSSTRAPSGSAHGRHAGRHTGPLKPQSAPAGRASDGHGGAD